MGALFHLHKRGIGASVELDTDTGVVLRYTVTARRVYDKAQLPADVFDTTGAPRLALITCGGPFDRRTGHYQDNIIVYAIPT